MLGTSRSGSTLLQSMLNSHSLVTIPPETHYFHNRTKYGRGIDSSASQKNLLNLVRQWHKHKTRMGDLEISQNLVESTLKELSITSVDDLYTLYLSLYRKERDKEIVGEKTPRHIRHVDTILSVYPDAKIISLFRDPRATALSELKAYFGSPSVMVTTRRWREYVELHDKWTRTVPSDQYMMIQYRDLIDGPEQTLRSVCDHIGISFETGMLDYHERDDVEKGFAPGEKSWKKETLEPLKKGKNRVWRKQLENWQVALIEETVGEWLTKMGYESHAEDIHFLKKWYFKSFDFSKSIVATLTNARDEGYREPTKF